MQKVELFKSKDFIALTRYHNSTVISSFAAELANKKLQEYLESCPVVYGAKGKMSLNKISWHPDNSLLDHTHIARLAFIEELSKEPCKHIPFIEYYPHAYGVYPKYAKCEICGVKLEAEWKEVE